MDDAYVDKLTGIAEDRGLEVSAFILYCDNQHIDAEDAEDAVDAFQNDFIGDFESDAKFAEYHADEEGLDIPDLVRPHIDWADVFHCELRHDYYELNGYYFRNN
jgi:antirestriction protein